jgi:NAD(P)-dependent dehydrogenase (short-subunit alcohol dehydrogenase family)
MSTKRVAIVTGGNRGIGRGISQRLAADGLAVAVIYKRRVEEAERTVAKIRAGGSQASAYQTDVEDRDKVHQLISRVLADFGRIDVLVNNAGVALATATIELTVEEWDYVVNVNLKGTFLCSQAVISTMSQQECGRIINISSIAGQTGGRIGAHYAASKAGVIGLTRFMARELGPLGITVNAIAPSGVPTDLLSDLDRFPSAERPVRRLGTIEDVAAGVSYLASSEASYVTGQLLSINGGSFIG